MDHLPPGEAISHGCFVCQIVEADLEGAHSAAFAILHADMLLVEDLERNIGVFGRVLRPPARVARGFFRELRVFWRACIPGFVVARGAALVLSHCCLLSWGKFRRS